MKKQGAGRSAASENCDYVSEGKAGEAKLNRQYIALNSSVVDNYQSKNYTFIETFQ